MIAMPLALLPVAAPTAGQLGLRGGINLTKFVGGDAADVDAEKKLNLGLSVPLLSVGRISLVPEVYYSMKGAAQSSPHTSNLFSFDLSYIELPILAKLNFPLIRGGALKAYFAGGPTFAWNVDCTFSVTASDTPIVSLHSCGEQFDSFDTAIKTADRGIVLSGGLDFKLTGFAGLNLDARLVRGLERLRKGGNGTDIKNQSFTLMLGYYLGQ